MDQKNGSEDNGNSWDNKRKTIKCNIHKGIKYREHILDDMNSVKNNFGKSSDQIRDELSRLKTLEEIYRLSSTSVDSNPVVEGSIDILVNNSEMDANRWSYLNGQWAPVKKQTESFYAGVIASGSLVPSMVSGSFIIVERIEPLAHRYQYTERLKAPTTLDRKRELNEKLRKFDPFFSSKLEGAWQTFHDSSKADRISQAATSFRELITNILNNFAPYEKVEHSFWFEPEKDSEGKTTRKQRIRYSMMGNNKEIEGIVFDMIIELVDNLFNEFDKLNKITHIQKFESDLEIRTENAMDQCQIHLLKLLDLRELYFKE